MKLIPCSTAAALLALLALAGCADMGNIKPQASQLSPTALKTGAAIQGASAEVQWPQERWWEALHDDQLNRLVNAALADNPSLHVAQARVRQAAALAGVAKAATLPRVDASASSTRELYPTHGSAPPPLAGNYAWLNTATLSGSYDLDLWGRNRDALASALDEARVASAEEQMSHLALETAVVRSYIQLSLEYALQDHIVENLATRQRLLEITRRRMKAGLASEIDVQNIETTLPASRREHEQIGESIALLRNQLAALIGKGPGDGDAIARPTLTLKRGEGQSVPRDLPAELLGHRPDIAAQRWRVEAAAARINVAKAEFYPNINLTAFAGLQSFGFDHFLRSDAAFRGVTPAISLPVFEGGRLRSQLGAQTAAYDGAVEQYNAAVIEAFADVANAIARINSVRQQEQLAQRALATAHRSQELAEKAYKAGLTDAVNVVNAELQVLNEEQQMVLVAGRQLDNFATLMAALGGGMKLDLP